MYKPSKFAVAIFITIICLIFNLILLIQKKQLDKKNLYYSNHLDLCLKKGNKLKINEFEQKMILTDSISDIHRLTSLVPSTTKPFTLMVFFESGDCSECLFQEVECLNEVNKENNIQLFAYYLKNNGGLELNDFKKYFKVQFQIKQIQDSLKNIVYLKNTPASFVIDTKKMEILDAYISEPDNPIKRTVFYKKWKRIIRTSRKSIV